MTPTFALDLAHDGIRLLYRAEGGWTVVGDVALEDPALPTRLAALRAEAERIAPGAVTTELIIPPSQIRYATIPATGADPSEDRIREAAAGLTPLEPEDLVLDWVRDGDCLRLALLDRTTLAEAETFAEAHGFNPIAFTARPTPDQFSRAPQFGTTARAADPAPAAMPTPLPPPALQLVQEPPRPEPAPIVGAEALALSLSAPRPGNDTAVRGERAPSRSRSRPRAVAAVAALLLVGAGAALGLRGGFPALPDLSDTPPAVAVAAPTPATAPPTPVTASAATAVALHDVAPVALSADVPGLSAPDTLDRPSADTAAPPALSDRAPLDAPIFLTGPGRPPAPTSEGSEAIYLASIDPRTRASDAVSLPPASALVAAPRPVTPLAPPPAGTTFDVDANGLVRATPDGAFTPDGIRVTQGRPPLLPPAAPARAAELDLVPTETAAALPGLRPRNRPSDLVERGERAALGGWTREELAGFRPVPRPRRPRLRRRRTRRRRRRRPRRLHPDLRLGRAAGHDPQRHEPARDQPDRRLRHRPRPARAGAAASRTGAS
jgi:hypothetical protein